MTKVALLIGVSQYEPGLNLLPAAVKDIEALRRVLQDPEMGGFDEVKTLANPQSHIMQFEIETLFDGRTKDDLVLLFFSGHGIKDDAGRLYFASRSTRKNAKGDLIRSTAVPTSFVHDIMNNSRAKRQAIILDCCFSGAFDPALQAKDDGSVDLQTQLGAEGRVVLTSSSSTQYSFEQQGSDLSIYTRYLVEGIETGAGDINSDGFISMLELHEYAASKVRETAPKMTPKIIVLKDKGFEIVLAKARVTDPKLKYRKIASRYANAGTIRPAGRAVLNTLRHQLGLTLEEATEIEVEVLRPYQERLANLQQYRETLIAEAEHEYPLSEFAHEDLNMLQQMLGLRDENILPIQQEVEAKFIQQSAAYQQNLVQYEQTLIDTIQREFPFSQQTRRSLEKLQQSLKLTDEDIARVEQPLSQQAELRHQEQLREAAERQQKEKERAEYENKLRRYEQEFTKAIQAEYPPNHYVIDGLKHFQQQLGLKDEDITQIEQPICKPLEAKYQDQLKQQQEAQQRQKLELEQKRQKAEYKKKLLRYEQEFSKAIQVEYPLSEHFRETLRKFQQILGLTQEQISRVEKPFLMQKETEYQQQAKQLDLRCISSRVTTDSSFSVVGIQLDASGFSVAVIKDFHVSVIPNSQGKLKTPDIIACTPNGEWLVGQEVKDQALGNQANIFEGILNLIGRHYDEIRQEGLDVSYNVIKGKDGFPLISCPCLNQNLKPEEIVANGLRNIVNHATQYLGWQIREVVISVPSCFTLLQRKAVQDVASLADLKCRGVKNSSTLAALSYGINVKDNETILIFDVSEGHIVASILEIGDGVFEVLSVLGKCFLISSREQQTLLKYFRVLLENTLLEAKISKDTIKKVFLTGSSSFIAGMEEQIRQITNKQIVKIPFSETAVVMGAAIYAGLLSGSVKDVLQLDVTSGYLGVKTASGEVSIIIRQCTCIPTKKSESFTTISDNQTSIDVQVVQGDSSHGPNIIYLGSFRLDGIAPAPSGTPRIEITFGIDANSFLDIEAVDKDSKQGISVSYTNLDQSLKQRSTIAPRSSDN
ncbi:Hsp70 family protein [Microcoleus sp. bin38.metabat.b11b12b14.051]|uniref:caspase, EACC1-associated type n=1 Tax=Microcoleus sp. bin38.metabat.b11b12b14.051 TaxID=2742709 RepID=UPI0025DDA68E|nr:Hsp70 family protein [Microcoleus sp. bin38.metabat.b11b12b14.051]